MTEGANATAGIFGTFSGPKISAGTAVIDQIVAVSFFLLLINAITDDRNMATPKGLVPIAIGKKHGNCQNCQLFHILMMQPPSTTLSIGVTDLGLMIFAFGFNCGAPINPARDLAPRIFTAMAGWGNAVFR